MQPEKTTKLKVKIATKFHENEEERIACIFLYGCVCQVIRLVESEDFAFNMHMQNLPIFGSA